MANKKKKERYGYIMAFVLEKEELSTQSKILYCALCTFADKKGKCYPTREQLMRYTSIGNTRTFASAVKELVENGIIEIEDRRKERASSFGGRIYHIKPGFDVD